MGGILLGENFGRVKGVTLFKGITMVRHKYRIFSLFGVALWRRQPKFENGMSFLASAVWSGARKMRHRNIGRGNDTKEKFPISLTRTFLQPQGDGTQTSVMF